MKAGEHKDHTCTQTCTRMTSRCTAASRPGRRELREPREYQCTRKTKREPRRRYEDDVMGHVGMTIRQRLLRRLFGSRVWGTGRDSTWGTGVSGQGSKVLNRRNDASETCYQRGCIGGPGYARVGKGRQSAVERGGGEEEMRRRAQYEKTKKNQERRNEGS